MCGLVKMKASLEAVLDWRTMRRDCGFTVWDHRGCVLSSLNEDGYLGFFTAVLKVFLIEI